MEITTVQKYIGSTPRKVRLVADMVRRMTPNQAVLSLGFTPNYAAGDLSKAIKTALANAKQQGAETDKLMFKKIEVNEGPKMKRYRAGTRGRAKPYTKRQSHIKIVLTDEINQTSLRGSKDGGPLRLVEDKAKKPDMKTKAKTAKKKGDPSSD